MPVGGVVDLPVVEGAPKVRVAFPSSSSSPASSASGGSVRKKPSHSHSSSKKRGETITTTSSATSTTKKKKKNKRAASAVGASSSNPASSSSSSARRKDFLSSSADTTGHRQQPQQKRSTSVKLNDNNDTMDTSDKNEPLDQESEQSQLGAVRRRRSFAMSAMGIQVPNDGNTDIQPGMLEPRPPKQQLQQPEQPAEPSPAPSPAPVRAAAGATPSPAFSPAPVRAATAAAVAEPASLDTSAAPIDNSHPSTSLPLANNNSGGSTTAAAAGASENQQPFDSDSSIIYSQARRQSWARFTRDTGIATSRDDRIAELRQAEGFLRSLPVLTFSVVKLFGGLQKKQERLLRLTADGIENVQPKSLKVSSSYGYRSVRKCALKSIDTLVLRYTAPIDPRRPLDVPQNHDYIYQSPVALAIMQEIEMRVSIHKATFKKKFTFDIALQYQSQLLSSSQDQVYSVTGQHGDPNWMATRRVTNSKIGKLLGSSSSQRAEAEVERVLRNRETTEGQAIAQFLKSFPGLCSKLGKSADTAGQLTLRVRQFLDAVCSMVVADRGPSLRVALLGGKPLPLELEQRLEQEIPILVEKIGERVVLSPLWHRLSKYVMKHSEPASGVTLREQADRFVEKMQVLKRHSHSQGFYGIQKNLQSPTNFTSSIAELNLLSTVDLPHEILEQLLTCVKSIYATVTFEQMQTTGKTIMVAADEFLPIFIYVVANSELQNPFLLCDMAWNFSDSQTLAGEGGYYLTVFASAIQYLLDLDPRATVANSGLHQQNSRQRSITIEMQKHSSFLVENDDLPVLSSSPSTQTQPSLWRSARPEESLVDNPSIYETASNEVLSVNDLDSDDSGSDSEQGSSTATFDMRQRSGPYGAIESISANPEQFLPPHKLLQKSSNAPSGKNLSPEPTNSPLDDAVASSPSSAMPVAARDSTSRSGMASTEGANNTNTKFAFQPFPESFRAKTANQSVSDDSDSTSEGEESRSLSADSLSTEVSLSSTEPFSSIAQMQRELSKRKNRLSPERKLEPVASTSTDAPPQRPPPTPPDSDSSEVEEDVAYRALADSGTRGLAEVQERLGKLRLSSMALEDALRDSEGVL